MEGVSAACRSLCEFVATRNSSSAVENGVQVGEATSGGVEALEDVCAVLQRSMRDEEAREIARESGALKNGCELLFIDDGVSTRARKLCIKFIANAVVRCEANQSVVWECFFPTYFFRLVDPEEDSVVSEVAIMVLFNCGCFDSARLLKVAGNIALLGRILHRSISGVGRDWCLCILDKLGHAGLLPDICRDIGESFEDEDFTVVALLEHLPAVVSMDKSASECVAQVCYGQVEASAKHVATVRGEHAEFVAKWIKASLSAASEVSLELSPTQQSPSTAAAAVALLRILTEIGASTLAARQCAIRLLGNMAFRCTPVQNMVLQTGGVELILSHTAVEMDSPQPVLKEWSVLAIRNLTEGNSSVQQHISNLQNKGVSSVPPQVTKEQAEKWVASRGGGTT